MTKLKLYRVTFTPRSQHEEIYALGENAREAERAAYEPINAFLEWERDAEEVDITKERASLPINLMLDDPETGKEISIKDWLARPDDFVGPVDIQKDFDALPKLFQGIAPKLIIEDPPEDAS